MTRRDREWYRAEEAMRLADAMSRLSTCRRLAVGCAIISGKLDRVVAVGYNGPPVGSDNGSCSGEPGRCGCVHAEANALVKAGSESGDAYVTHSPCPHCAGLVANSGGRVRSVTYRTRFRDSSGVDRLRSAGVEVREYGGVVPSTIVLGERANGEETERDATVESGTEWWRTSLARGAFLDPMSQRKLASVGVDLSRVRSANLVPPSPRVGEWSEEDRRRAADSWLAALQDQPGATFVICGRRAWESTTGRRSGEFGDETTSGGARLVLVPHPSGLSRWWNDRVNPVALRRRLRLALPDLV